MTLIEREPTVARPPMSGRLIERVGLTETQRAAMYALLDEHFAGVSPAQFEGDLGEKNFVILLERPGGDVEPEICGFSTLLAYETQFRGEPVSVVYSGDTIVARDAWGSATLPRTWIESVNRLRERFPRGRYYWTLITSGYRTYHFLPLFWREFFPRYEVPTPPGTQALLDHLARERFGTAYDAATGVVRFPSPQALRGDLGEITPERLKDPHVAFFAARNPGHARGEELACLTELTPENLTAAGRRMIRGPVHVR